MTKSVFITGATGYIGGTTLAFLLTNPNTKSFSYSALVRSKEKAVLLEAFGVRPVVADRADAAVLAAEAEKADIVIHTAGSADHLPSSQAILSGMKKRGDNPILIHISGAGVLLDAAGGGNSTDEVYSDLDLDRLYSLPDHAVHRNVELEVLAAASDVRTHIISPPIVWGLADHALAKAGISNPSPIMVPVVAHIGIKRGQGGILGKGLNIWGNVHVDELAAIILRVLEAAIAGKSSTGREGYYFTEADEQPLCEMYAEITRVLSAHGIGNPEPTPLTVAEIEELFPGGSIFLGGNARSKAERSRQLGWSPTLGSSEFTKSIAAEVECVLRKEGRGTYLEGRWKDLA